MNRVRSRHYPNSICAVVYQGSERSTGCQFTFTCDGSKADRPRGRAWDRAQRVATAVMLGYTRPITHNATHYHTHAVNPVWNSGLVETANIGSHVFYRFPNRSERAQYQAALDRRLEGRRRAAPAVTEAEAPEATVVPATTPEAAPAPEPETGAIEASAPAHDEPISVGIAT
jgi:hypothetical protein